MVWLEATVKDHLVQLPILWDALYPLPEILQSTSNNIVHDAKHIRSTNNKVATVKPGLEMPAFAVTSVST